MLGLQGGDTKLPGGAPGSQPHLHPPGAGLRQAQALGAPSRAPQLPAVLTPQLHGPLCLNGPETLGLFPHFAGRGTEAWPHSQDTHSWPWPAAAHPTPTPTPPHQGAFGGWAVP